MPENKKHNFIRQGSILAVASILVRLIGIVYRIPMSNIIGDEGNGIYSAAYEVYSLALILSSYSLPLAVSKLLSLRLVNKEFQSAQKIFYASFIFAIVSGGIMALILLFGADFIEKTFYAKYPGMAVPLRVLSLTIFIVALLGTLRGFFQARKTMIPTAVSQIIEQIINAIASIYFAYTFIKLHSESDIVNGWGAAGGTMGTLLGALAGFLFLAFIYVIYNPIVKKQIRQDLFSDDESYSDIFKMIIATVIPVILSQTVYQASGVIDSIIYSNTATGDNVAISYGIYSTKYRLLVNVPIAIASAMGSSMIPTIVSSYASGSKKKVRQKIATSIKFNMIIAIPCSAGLMALGTPIIKLLFTNTDYELGGRMLIYGGIAVIFYALSTVTNAALQGIDLMKKPVTHSAISLIVHIILIFVLLKFTKLGIHALVIGNVTFPLLVCILNAITLKKHLRYRQEITQTFVLPLIASAIMGICAYVIYQIGYLTLHSNAIACIFAIMVAVGIYFVLVIVLGAITEEDFRDFPMGMRLKRIARKLHLI